VNRSSLFGDAGAWCAARAQAGSTSLGDRFDPVPGGCGPCRASIAAVRATIGSIAPIEFGDGESAGPARRPAPGCMPQCRLSSHSWVVLEHQAAGPTMVGPVQLRGLDGAGMVLAGRARERDQGVRPVEASPPHPLSGPGRDRAGRSKKACGLGEIEARRRTPESRWLPAIISSSLDHAT